MVTIRLSRFGRKRNPFYKIVVTDSRCVSRGSFIEKIGFFNPFSLKKKDLFQIDVDRLTYWRNNGAKLSKRVKWILKSVKGN
ncbi:30S ribosomal protein S16 [Candidatus Riesia pediculischaeffi]|uniref:Small ribosomal subunit protein bS16 n=2 Tax=Candidatus Riesia pediculischaeffi TaxID=428411 RepID=A0A1V0HKW8_9ENTR|nr:30S ribosomal protein S16 [Candidatus Riesia pediculischaeffi]ARC53480.1 30S ribosomal protein S16 [Candidatus Riesia pediculischaeffi]KIE64034.1 SSU ribosomal protein S16p [Candidatus Riesia pediculischaeffi PTSU]